MQTYMPLDPLPIRARAAELIPLGGETQVPVFSVLPFRLPSLSLNP